MDEQVESIFGQSMEQLFGQPIASFLDSHGQHVVKDLLRKHSRFETSFDSCQVDLIVPGGGRYRANLIFTLCFAAGNPVNYQILIDRVSSRDKLPESLSGDGIEQLLETLAEISSLDDLTQLISALSLYLNEPRVAFYHLVNDKLDLLEAKSGTPATLPELNDLHLYVAHDGESYSVDDEQAVSDAIELIGKAPSEFICRLNILAGTYLIRVVVDEGGADSQTQQILQRARLAAELIGRWLGQQPSVPAKGGSHSRGRSRTESILKTTDLLGFAALLVNSNGEIAAHNAAAGDLLGLKLNGAIYRELFIDQLRPIIKEDLPRLNFYVEQAFKAVTLPLFESAIMLPDGRVASLMVMRSNPEDNAADLLMTLVPVPEVARAQTTQRTFAMALSSFEDLTSLGRVATDYTSQLSHEYFSQLNGDGNFVLMCLSSCLDKMMTSLIGYKEMFRFGTRLKKNSQADLNVLMNELQLELEEQVRNVRINISYNDLPQLRTEPLALKTVLRLLLGELIGEWTREEFKLSVKCTQQAKLTTLGCQLPSDCPRTGVDGIKLLLNLRSLSANERREQPNPLGLAVENLLTILDASAELDEEKQMLNLTLQHQPDQAHS